MQKKMTPLTKDQEALNNLMFIVIADIQNFSPKTKSPMTIITICMMKESKYNIEME